MSKLEKLLLASIPTSEKLYRFPSINEGTLGLVDMKSAWSGGARNLAPAATLKNLCYVDDPAVVGAVALNYDADTGGLIFTGVGLEYVQTPTAFIPTSDMTDYMHTYWLKIDPTNAGSISFNNAIIGMGVGGYATPGNMFNKVTPTITSGGVTNIEVNIRGKNYPVFSQLSGLIDGNVHCLSLRYLKSDDGTQQKGLIYLDGTLVYEASFAALVAYPAGVVNVAGVGVKGVYTRTFSGRFYRARMDDLTLTSKTAEQVLSDEIAAVSGRFS